MSRTAFLVSLFFRPLAGVVLGWGSMLILKGLIQPNGANPQGNIENWPMLAGVVFCGMVSWAFASDEGFLKGWAQIVLTVLQWSVSCLAAAAVARRPFVAHAEPGMEFWAALGEIGFCFIVGLLILPGLDGFRAVISHKRQTTDI